MMMERQSKDPSVWSDTQDGTYQQIERRFSNLVAAIEDYAIFMLDPQGLILSWNAGAQKIKGYAPDEILGRPFTVFYPADEIARGWPQKELQLAAQNGRFEDEGWRLRKSGERFWANVVITALRDEHGQLYGFAKVTRDLTERRHHEELLRRSEERFRLLVENVRDYAVFMLDVNGHVESWNAGAQSLMGYAEQEVVGKHFSLFSTPELRALERPQHLLQAAVKHGHASDEGWRVRKDGSVFWAHVTVTPIRDADGRLRGFAKVTRDMTQERRAQELEASARRVSEFIAILGHELRNPLAPIRNAVAVMELDPTYPPKLRPIRDIIKRQLNNVTRLVDDLLDIGRVTNGKIVLQREAINWQGLIERIVEAAEPFITEHGHTLTVALPKAPITVFGDPTRLQQVIQNLLNNAAKYTPRGGVIAIESELEDGMLAVHIKDNGIGLAPEALERIFDLFVQEKQSATSHAGGLGIGLAMARILVELHGGSVHADSPGEGQGSTFTLRLPLTDQLPAPDADDGLVHDSAPQAYPILVVDDNRDSTETMAELIKGWGHHVEAVVDAHEAVSVAQAMQPRLILLDLMMPGKGGYDVLADLRALSLPRSPLIVAMTGLGQPQDRRDTTAAGFDGHLTKPVDPVQLRRLITAGR